jgi:hypothetical protein
MRIGMSVLLACTQSLACAAFGADASTALQAPEETPVKMAQSAPVQLRASAVPVLTPGAIEAAKLLNILPKVERLRQLAQNHVDGQPMTDEEMALKVDVMDRIMGGSLEVRMVAGRIDRELAWSFSGQGMLQAKRQKILNYLFAANFMQGGILGTTSGPMFLDKKPQVGTELLLLASSIGLFLSTVSFIEAKNQGSKRMDDETTVLAYVYDLNPPEPNHKPEIVTKFMRSVPPGATDNKTRVQSLMGNWQRGRYLRSTDETNLRRLSAFQPDGAHWKENISLLTARIRMLFDTQWTMEQLDGELLDLLRACDVIN